MTPGDQPVQYKKGWVEFYKLKFKVTPDVLIPRPETELLVDEVLQLVNRQSLIVSRKTNTTNYKRYTIIDLGTGSGNISVSIAQNLAPHLRGGQVKIIATDISAKALKVAKQNAKYHHVDDKIELIQSDLLSKIPSTLPPANCTLVIVTNLPYIPTSRIPYLDASVKDYEPHLALDGGEDGFGLYEKLFQQIKQKGLKPNLIIGEIDYTHGELAANIAYKYFPQAQIEVKKDLAHKQRILVIDWAAPAALQ